jgi:hypothetical protein
VVLGTLGAVEGEVEPPVGLHDPADVREALLDHLDRGVREHAVRVHHVEVPVGQEREAQVLHRGEVRHLARQAVLDHGVLGGEQDVRRDVDAVVVAGLEVVDEQPPGPQVAAADLEQPVLRPQPVFHQVVELHPAEREPALVRPAAHRALGVAGGVVLHHRPVVADVVGGAQPQPGVAGQPAQVRRDPLRVAYGVADLVDEAGPGSRGHGTAPVGSRCPASHRS